MAVWRRPVRFALAAFIVGLGTAVVFGLRDRAEPVRPLVVERTDPDAVIQTRGSRIVRADSLGDDLRVEAERQLTYPDGALRMTDGVKVTVEEREDREGFVLTGTEASVDADKTQVTLTGDITFTSGGGLHATSDAASYADAEGIVRMPGEALFTRDGMHATGQSAEYERGNDLLRLLDGARVDLATEGASTQIVSRTATVAQTNGYMTFDGGVVVDAGRLRMEARRARATFVDAISQLDALQLQGNSKILGTEREAGRLREMSASDIRLGYDETGQRITEATLIGGAALDLFGAGGTTGAHIGGRSMDVRFTADGNGVSGLTTHDEVIMDIPETTGQPGQRVRADALQATSASGRGLDEAVFEGSVEYLETISRTEGDPISRVARAERLDATMGDGLSALESATFRGSVTFEDGEVHGQGDEARYIVGDSIVKLVTVGPDGQAPRVVDRRGSVQAETIRIMLDGPRIEARGGVESVLSTSEDDADDSETEVRRPGLLDADQPVLVTADQLSYDGETQIATYSGDAHLWQAETEFRGDTIVLDEKAGNLSVDSAVRTRSLLKQMDDETGVQQESVTTGRAVSMRYDDSLHRATYTIDAEVSGPRGDLKADTIHVYLHQDSRTLDRLEASGDVSLETPGRLVAGETLVYYDADGRYEMAGEPVRIVEEVEEECRETTGRTLTFFITGDDVSVDGQAEVRTETASGRCPELIRQ